MLGHVAPGVRDSHFSDADMGTYFMSICKEIQLVAEQWTGTRVEVSEVLRAMQHNLHGRVETAFGGGGWGG
jgi:hypothetical protein